MSLVLYSSSESDNEECLPAVQSTEDVEKKTDRVRLFPHQEGNWALSIYAFVDCSSHMDSMVDDLMDVFNEKQETWKRLAELHISLSRTFPIRFHHIESIRKGIQNELATSMIKFPSRLENVTILNNEDGSTSFLVFTLDQTRQFTRLIELVDKILSEHRYPRYYENPCFHVSFAYSTDAKREARLPKDWKEKCQSVFQQYRCQPSSTAIFIDDIRLKAGNRVYQLTKAS